MSVPRVLPASIVSVWLSRSNTVACEIAWMHDNAIHDLALADWSVSLFPIKQQTRDTYLAHAGSRAVKANFFLSEMLARPEFTDNCDEIKSLLKNTDETAYKREEVYNIVEKVRMKPQPEALQELFWILHWFSNSTFPRSRLAAFGFIAVGGIFVCIVMVLQLYKIFAAL